MQFDEATREAETDAWHNTQVTTFDAIVAKFKAAGYKLPGLVFWNLRASKVAFTYPILHTEMDCAMVSGFNVSIVNDILSGKEMSPYAMIKRLLDSPRYAAIRL